MEWNLPEQLSAAESRVAKRIRKRSRFFLFLREIRHELFDEAFQLELIKAYAPRGQEPVAPALLAVVTLLVMMALTGPEIISAPERCR